MIKWTEEENNLILSSIAANKTYLEMTALLPHRTQRAIAFQGSKLRKAQSTYNKWTDEEIKILIDLRIKGVFYKDCVKFINKSSDSIKQKGAELLKLTKDYDLEEYDCAWEFLKLYYNDEL